MEKIIPKEKAKELMEIKGEVRGLAIKADLEFIFARKGEEGLENLEKAMSELGYPVKNEEIKSMDFYPMGLLALTTSVVKELFNFDREEFIEMGEFAARVPLVIRIFMKYFGSIDILAKAAPKMWRTYYTRGELKVIKYSQKEKYASLRVKDYPFPSHQCHILEGYIAKVVSIAVKAPVNCLETKCIHKGDSYHEFLVKW